MSEGRRAQLSVVLFLIALAIGNQVFNGWAGLVVGRERRLRQSRLEATRLV